MRAPSRDEVYKLYIEEKLTAPEIAKRLGHKQKTVEYVIHKHRIRKADQVRRIDVGETFNDVTVVGFSEQRQSRPIIKCVCGIQKRVYRSDLLDGAYSSCGCRSAHHQSVTRGFLFHEINLGYWSSLQAGARSRDREFSITLEYVWDLFLKQDRRCALSGIDIYFKQVKKKTQTASLDRIDSNLGYVPGNVQWVHKDINFMKQALPEDKFLDYCTQIVRFQNERRTAA